VDPRFHAAEGVRLLLRFGERLRKLYGYTGTRRPARAFTSSLSTRSPATSSRSWPAAHALETRLAPMSLAIKYSTLCPSGVIGGHSFDGPVLVT
jgi:hypothetical protein